MQVCFLRIFFRLVICWANDFCLCLAGIMHMKKKSFMSTAWIIFYSGKVECNKKYVIHHIILFNLSLEKSIFIKFIWAISDLLYCRLDIRKKTWRLLSVSVRKVDLKGDQRCRNERKNNPPLPCEKSLMKSYKNYLYLFGGYGPSPEQYHNYPADSVFELDETSSWAFPHGWNANVYRYCIENESWEWVKCKGQYPVPRAGTSTATIVLLCFI